MSYRALSQAIVGYLSDKIGVTFAFYTLILFAAAALVLSFFISDVRELPTQADTSI